MGLSFNTEVQGYNFSIKSNYTKLYNDYKKFLFYNSLLNYSDESERIGGSLFGKYKFNAVNNTEVSIDLGVKTEQFNSKQPITRFQNLITSLLFERKLHEDLCDKTYFNLGFSRDLF